MSSRFSFSCFHKIARIFIFISAFAIFVQAQSTTKSNTDGMTPAGIAPGAPAGSYPLSGIENVNLFNRRLNFMMPLLKVGGRGSAQVTIPLRIEQKWRVNHAIAHNMVCNQSGCTPGNPPINHYYYPTPNWWNGLDPGYGPGVLTGRQAGQGTTTVANCGTGSITKWAKTITRLTFTIGDGTEFELRDEAFNGEPKNSVSICTENNTNRGTVFKTADGSSATFISTTAIYDKEIPPTSSPMFYPTGNLWLKDGTVYYIENGLVKWIRDRNGNKISFTYDGYKRVQLIQDSLNRQVSFTYGDHTAYQSDFITFAGNGGTTRTIEIGYASLASVLLTGSVQTYAALFPSLTPTATTHQPPVVSYVRLPDYNAVSNNRQYSFRYNSYGELARVVLPTGGATEYDWSGPTDNVINGYSQDGNNYVEKEIIRYVTVRRIYSNGGTGTTYESRTTYDNNINVSTPTIVKTYAYTATTPETVEQHYFSGTVVGDLFQSGIYYANGLTGKEVKTEFYDSETATIPLRKTENTWWFRQPVSWTGATSGQPGNDPRITDVTTSLLDNSNNLVSKIHTDYDSSVNFNQPTVVEEYDYGPNTPGALIRQTVTTYQNSPTYLNTPVHIRSLTTQVTVKQGNTTALSTTSYEYDNYTPDANQRHAALVNRTSVSGFDTAFGTSYYTRGNVTKVTNGSVNSYSQFDILGNVVKTLDANDSATMVEFNDRFGSPNGEAQSNTAPATWLGGLTTFAFPTKITNALGHISYTQFDYYLGKPVDTEDPNSVKSSIYYADLLDRPTKSIRAVGVSTVVSQTQITYDDPNKVVTVAGDKDANADGLLVSKSYYDGLGRGWRKASFEGGTNWSIVETQFDGLGRAYRSSTPFRASSPTAALPTDPLWTTTTFDKLGRVTQVLTPDAAHVDSAYNGNQVTVTDQAGKKRKSETDGLGRLTKVWEDPTTLNYLTTYTYDALDNLLTVNQGSQTRTFTYDSLKRLLTSNNPESGQITYTYYPNGNLNTKTDARTTKTTFTYDAINRVTSKTYSGTTSEGINAANATQPVYYKYDNQAFNGGAPAGFLRGLSIGRLVAINYGSNTASAGSYLGYDELCNRAARNVEK